MSNIYKYVVILICFTSAITFISCNDDDNQTIRQQALTEKDFISNPDLFANPEEGVVVSFLESGNAALEDNLTGELGFDEIKYKYTRAINNTFCFEDKNDNSLHSMILLNSDVQEVLSVEANGNCVTEVIVPGEYVLQIQHGEHVDKIDAIFIQPQDNEEMLVKEFKNKNLFNKLVGFFTAALPKLELVKPSYAQDEGTDDNVTTLISTNSCEGCDFFETDLSEADLSGACFNNADLNNTDLSSANLSSADLFEANLTSANLSSANLSNSSVFGANALLSNWTNADMTNADMTGVKFTEADLTNAVTTNTDFQGAVFTDAILDGVDFTGLNVTGADFSGATVGDCVCDTFCFECI